jgi:hypothetical protein
MFRPRAGRLLLGAPRTGISAHAGSGEPVMRVRRDGQERRFSIAMRRPPLCFPAGRQPCLSKNSFAMAALKSF